jgi:hypothetical protein
LAAPGTAAATDATGADAPATTAGAIRPAGDAAAAAGARPATAGILQYQRKGDAALDKRLDTEKLKNIQAPIALIAGGIVVLYAQAWWTAGVRGFLPAAAALGIDLVAGTMLMLIAVFMVARVRGFQMGPIGPAILKLMAVSVAPAAVMALSTLLLHVIP